MHGNPTRIVNLLLKKVNDKIFGEYHRKLGKIATVL